MVIQILIPVTLFNKKRNRQYFKNEYDNFKIVKQGNQIVSGKSNVMVFAKTVEKST